MHFWTDGSKANVRHRVNVKALSLKFNSCEQLEQMFIIRDKRSEQQQLGLGEKRLVSGTRLSMQQDRLVEDPTEFRGCWLVSLLPAFHAFRQFSKSL